MADAPGFVDRRRRPPCRGDATAHGDTPWLYAAAFPGPAQAHAAYQQLFARSREESRSLTLLVLGKVMAGVVLRADGRTVELRNRMGERLVVRVDLIEAVWSL